MIALHYVWGTSLKTYFYNRRVIEIIREYDTKTTETFIHSMQHFTQ